MHPVSATFRLLIAATLVVSPGTADVCCFVTVDTGDFSAVCAVHRNACSCDSKSDSCCSGTQCTCAGHLPPPIKFQAVPDRSIDRVQLALLDSTFVDIGTSVFGPTSLALSPACLTGFTTNLIAQGTRLNI